MRDSHPGPSASSAESKIHFFSQNQYTGSLTHFPAIEVSAKASSKFKSIVNFLHRNLIYLEGMYKLDLYPLRWFPSESKLTRIQGGGWLSGIIVPPISHSAPRVGQEAALIVGLGQRPSNR